MPTGHYEGRNYAVITEGFCEVCERRFVYKHYDGKEERRFCGNACHMAYERERRRKVPNDKKLLESLYWEHQLSLTEIAELFCTDHSVVKRRMIQLGIKRHPVGPKVSDLCIVPSCDRPVFRIQHKGNKSFYGVRCEYHWREYRSMLSTHQYHARGKWRKWGLEHCSDEEKAWLNQTRNILSLLKRRAN